MMESQLFSYAKVFGLSIHSVFVSHIIADEKDDAGSWMMGMWSVVIKNIK
jgi:hypothetical protein